ncbi:2,3-butanediol dehydrogenase [Halalkalicoccus sp. NIPERK01]|uniref:2,3-butanediol dehydrogenase n=1 Tax=Halalkalicoccus sp. NIPERK01 TaxID=3053469 RepID=UPI00256F2AE6|nr:2,3-butanediol dehydrogenase [Halalkalicoccus sp. NIPERK01]MDL5363256.1 2,3-butanediol dehydrogenase [Halalkalicoccus sp. NIPERK01]
MRAARFHDSGDVRVEDIESTPVGETDIRIEIEACGICGSDLHEYRIGPHITSREPNPRTGQNIPITLGHEFSGTVSEVGAGVSRIATGDRVTVEPNIPCGDCLYCEDGKYNLCKNAAAVGFHTGAGGFAENAVVPEQQVHVLPDDVTLEDGALVEPLAVGLHAVRQSGLQAGDTVGVFGCGPIGLTVVRAATAAGAKRIFVSEPNESRREVALELGADVGIDPMDQDAVDAIKKETDDGVEIAFEFAGIGPAFNAAVQSTQRDGTITVGSLNDSDISTNINDIVTTERKVVGTNCYGFPPRSFRTEFDAIIQSLAAGDIDTDAFITGRIDLKDITEEGFEALLDSETDHVKILVEP